MKSELAMLKAQAQRAVVIKTYHALFDTVPEEEEYMFLFKEFRKWKRTQKDRFHSIIWWLREVKQYEFVWRF